MELGIQKGKLSRTTTQLPSADPKKEETYLASPTGKRLLLYYPSRGRKIFCLPSNKCNQWEHCNSATGKPSLAWTLTFLWWTFIQNTSSQPFPLLYKVTLLSFVCWTWLCMVFAAENCNSPLSLNKLILLVK